MDSEDENIEKTVERIHFNPLDSDDDDSSSKRPTTRFKCVVVVDLDMTLIDVNKHIYVGVDKFLMDLKKLGATLCLWTAGNKESVDYFFRNNSRIKKLWFSYLIYGLTNNHKPVNVLRLEIKKTKSLLSLPTFIIDDNNKNLVHGGYDFKIDIQHYLEKISTSKASKKVPNYIQVIDQIKLCMNEWRK